MQQNLATHYDNAPRSIGEFVMSTGQGARAQYSLKKHDDPSQGGKNPRQAVKIGTQPSAEGVGKQGESERDAEP